MVKNLFFCFKKLFKTKNPDFRLDEIINWYAYGDSNPGPND